MWTGKAAALGAPGAVRGRGYRWTKAGLEGAGNPRTGAGLRCCGRVDLGSLSIQFLRDVFELLSVFEGSFGVEFGG